MKKKEESKKQKTNSLKKFITRIFRFFFPKDWIGEIIKGQIVGEQIREGRLTPKMMPTWWIGKGLRKIIDPKHNMKFGGKKNG